MNTPTNCPLAQRILVYCLFLSVMCMIPSISFAHYHHPHGGVNVGFAMGAPVYPGPAVYAPSSGFAVYTPGAYASWNWGWHGHPHHYSEYYYSSPYNPYWNTVRTQVVYIPVPTQTTVVTIPENVQSTSTNTLSTPAVQNSFFDVWVTLNPRNTEVSTQYTNMWNDISGVHDVKEIPQQDFNAYSDAFCLLVWDTQKYSNAVYIVYRYVGNGKIDPEALESGKEKLFEGTQNFFYVPHKILDVQQQEFVWVEVVSRDGQILSRSNLIPLKI